MATLSFSAFVPFWHLPCIKFSLGVNDNIYFSVISSKVILTKFYISLMLIFAEISESVFGNEKPFSELNKYTVTIFYRWFLAYGSCNMFIFWNYTKRKYTLKITDFPRTLIDGGLIPASVLHGGLIPASALDFGVSSWFSGFLPQSSIIHFTLNGISKLSVVCKWQDKMK